MKIAEHLLGNFLQMIQLLYYFLKFDLDLFASKGKYWSLLNEQQSCFTFIIINPYFTSFCYNDFIIINNFKSFVTAVALSYVYLSLRVCYRDVRVCVTAAPEPKCAHTHSEGVFTLKILLSTCKLERKKKTLK